MTAHARLSASGSQRWLNCTPSLLLEEEFEDTTSDFAKEGTLAHAVAELKASKYFLKGIGPKNFKKGMDIFKQDELWNPEMDRYTDDYFDYLKSLSIGLIGRPYVAIEKKVEYGEWADEGFGTADCIMISGDALHVIDFKYGKGVPVYPEENTQLMLYGLGAYASYGFLYDIKQIYLHVVQPRLDNFSSWGLTIDELLKFGEYVKGQSSKAIAGEGDFKVGEHCRFCRAKAVCRARAEENIKLAGFTKIEPKTLTNEEVGKYLFQAQDLKKWVSDLEEYALSESLAGREVLGWKAVEGRSNRKITDELGFAEILVGAGFEEAVIYKPKSLETLSNLEKLVGKKELAELGKELIIKPQGKPTLVKLGDKREAITNVISAEEAFS
ncbi:MAG: DUF2800 domain-containing protein [Tissierellia bacterium]|nr:DUF2800 domain-containing protein [Tissierellia bacterium]